MANWSALPDGVIALIARLLELSEFISFRGTCTSWRLATSFKDFQKKWCPGLPFLMINRTKDEDGDDREFFNFYKGKVITISLTETKNKLCIGTKGWFFTIGSSGDMSLLNPITRVQIQLPNISGESYCWVKRAVLTASPTNTSEYIVMIVYREIPKQMNYIGFWKPEDPAWTKIEAPANLNDEGIRDVSYHNGKFYALSYSRHVWMFDVFGTNTIIPIEIEIMNLPSSLIHNSTYEAFFVDCEATLLVVSSFYTVHRDCSPHRVLELVELDLINGTCTKITNLGDKSVFIGNNEGFCVNALRFPGVIRPNHIYLSNGSYQLAGCEGRMDINHNVKAGIFYSDSHTSPSSSNYCNVWVTPNL